MVNLFEDFTCMMARYQQPARSFWPLSACPLPQRRDGVKKTKMVVTMRVNMTVKVNQALRHLMRVKMNMAMMMTLTQEMTRAMAAMLEVPGNERL
jgi:hypothetical protein